MLPTKHTRKYFLFCTVLQQSKMTPSSPDQVELLKELKEISNKSSSARHQKARCHPAKTLPEKENAICDACSNEFLRQTAEKTDFNQYWYSKATIDTLSGVIRESWDISGDKKVAFLSTPSLFFSLSEEERKNCALFDVSPFVLQCKLTQSI